MKKRIIVLFLVLGIISNIGAQNNGKANGTVNGTVLENKTKNKHTLVSKKHEQKLTKDTFVIHNIFMIHMKIITGC